MRQARSTLSPRRLAVQKPELTIDGHRLQDVELGGWTYGPELGSAPVCLIVGGITATPFPFGNGEEHRAWWPALLAVPVAPPDAAARLPRTPEPS